MGKGQVNNLKSKTASVLTLSSMLAREACEKTCKIYKTKFGPAIFFSLLPQQPWIRLRTSSSQMDLSLHQLLLVLIPCSIVPIFRFFKATLCACCARTDQDRLFPLLLLLLESELEQVFTTRRLEWENYYRRKSRLPSSVLSRIFFLWIDIWTTYVVTNEIIWLKGAY